MTLRVREKPPLAVSLSVLTPGGRHYRWADDEASAENITRGLRWSDTMPGGHENLDVVLSRDPQVDYSDLERLSTISVIGNGGAIAEYRLERAPRASGNDLAITPSAVGWQAHLDDYANARVIYRDTALAHWGEMSHERRQDLLTLGLKVDGTMSTLPDSVTPALEVRFDRIVATAANPQRFEAWYDAHGLQLGSVYYDYDGHNIGAADANWTAQLELGTDDQNTAFQAGTNHMGTSAQATVTASGVAKKFANWVMQYAATITSDGTWAEFLRSVAVYGNTGLTKRGVEPDAGFLASDIVRHAVTQWAPLLRFTSDTIIESSLIIPDLVYLEPTTAGRILQDVTAFELQDWAVWNGRTLHWAPPGTFGRNWRARVGSAQLEETGPQVDRVWTGAVVTYKDAAGVERTVGPTGSGADLEDDRMEDADPENAAVRAGVTRWRAVSLGTATADLAIATGSRFLEQSKALETSGRARIVGHVEDEHGATWPYHAVRSGDTIAFVDASDPSPRRIVRAEKDASAKSCVMDLDAPPDGLAGLLQRLNAS